MSSDRPFRVFLASTFQDLGTVRRMLEDAFKKVADHISLMALEYSPAGVRGSTREYCRNRLREANFVVFIMGHRYGSVPAGCDESMTALEYEATREAELPYAVFAVDPSNGDGTLPRPSSKDPMDPRQEAFRQRVKSEINSRLNFTIVSTLHDLVSDVWSSVSKAEKEHRRYSEDLQEFTKKQVTAQLSESTINDNGASANNEFSTKYKPSLFQPRKYSRANGDRRPIRSAFWDEFVPSAYKTNCFVVVGSTGAGKTNLICDIANQSLSGANVVPVLISGSTLEAGPGALSRALLKALHADDVERFPERELSDLLDIIADVVAARPLSRLVILLDAINELPSRSDAREFIQFNHDFKMLLEALAGKRWRGEPLARWVRFCITCRIEYWKQFSDQASGDVWVPFIFDAPPGRPTVVLGKFDDEEFEVVLPQYYSDYKIRNLEIRGSARDVLREPVMLRYFCEAYGSHDLDFHPSPKTVVEVVESISRMEIFERMIEKYRSLLLKDTFITDPEKAFRLTTELLITIAYRVHNREGSRSFTVEEAQKVAQDIDHPDASLTEEAFENSNRSVFRRMVGHRLLIDKDPGRNSYWFVFDSYYEFSLGRYFALMMWTRMSDEEALRSLDSLLGQSEGSAELPTRFSEAIGALPYAVLIVESNELFARRRRLFSRMIETLLRGPYIWAQQGLAILRDSKLASAASWADATKPGTDPQLMEDKQAALDSVMDLLETIVTSGVWDHVQLEDVRRTLLQLSRAHAMARSRILAGLDDWASPPATSAQDSGQVGLRLRRIYAAGTLFRLRRQTGPDRDFDKMFKRFTENPLIARDFWTVRSLVAAADLLFRRWTDGAEGADEIQRLYFDSIAHIAEANEDGSRDFSDAAAIRGECVAALGLLTYGRAPLVRVLIEFLERESNVWVWWRLVHSIRVWQKGWPLEFPEWALKRASGFPSRHLDDVLRRTITELGNKGIAISSAPRRQGEWDSEPDPSDVTRGNLDEGLIVYHPIFLEPEYANHLECRERLASILFALRELPNVAWTQPTDVSEELLDHVHTPETDRHRGGAPWVNYRINIKEAEEAAQKGSDEEQISGPIEMRPGVLSVAQFSAGAVVTAVRYLHNHKNLRAAWAVNRPPGHLANNVICVFNNAACGAQFFINKTRHVPQPGQVVIIDFDVHHGKHTQRVFYNRQDVAYVSLHVDGSYSKEEGTVEATGEGVGKGFTFNLPYPATCRDETFLILIDELVVPIVLGLKPSLIVLSCGFDALASDPITPQGLLTVGAYAGLGRLLREAVDTFQEPRPKIAGTIEGGYSLSELGQAFVALVREFGPQPQTHEIPFELQNDPEVIKTVRERMFERLKPHARDEGPLGGVYQAAQQRKLTARHDLRPIAPKL